MSNTNIEKSAELNELIVYLIKDCKITSFCKVVFLALALYENRFRISKIIALNKYERIDKLLKYTCFKNLHQNENFIEIFNLIEYMLSSNCLKIQNDNIVFTDDRLNINFSLPYLSEDMAEKIFQDSDTYSDETFLKEIMKYV